MYQQQRLTVGNKKDESAQGRHVCSLNVTNVECKQLLRNDYTTHDFKAEKKMIQHED